MVANKLQLWDIINDYELLSKDESKTHGQFFYIIILNLIHQAQHATIYFNSHNINYQLLLVLFYLYLIIWTISFVHLLFKKCDRFEKMDDFLSVSLSELKHHSRKFQSKKMIMLHVFLWNKSLIKNMHFSKHLKTHNDSKWTRHTIASISFWTLI